MIFPLSEKILADKELVLDNMEKMILASVSIMSCNFWETVDVNCHNEKYYNVMYICNIYIYVTASIIIPRIGMTTKSYFLHQL